MFIRQNKSAKHNFFMSLALLQAQKNLGRTRKNPSVGCVIVKNQNVISASSTGVNGRPHAEVNALSFSKNTVKGSDLYVTLEPCSHHGVTPPCTSAIIKKGIKRVFFSVHDPDIRSYKKSSKLLENKNIKVKKNIYVYKIKNFYKSYMKFKTNKLPHVTAKLAISKDSFANNKLNKWITNKFSRGRVHLMRSYHDIILTSASTVIADNPRYNCRIDGLDKNSPAKVILDKNLKIPLNSNIIKLGNKNKTLIFYNKINEKKIHKLKKYKIKLIKFNLNKNANFDLKEILIKIKSLGYSRIFVESGIKLMNNFLNENLVDDLYIFKSSKKIGKYGFNNFKKSIKHFTNGKKTTIFNINLHGDKMFLYNLK